MGCGGISSVAEDTLCLHQLCRERNVLLILKSQLQGLKVFPLMMSHALRAGRGVEVQPAGENRAWPASDVPRQEVASASGCREPSGGSGPG